MSINKVVLTGNLTRDGEIRSTQSGTSVLNFSIAVNDRVRNATSGEWEDYANYVNCVVFGRRADAISQYLTKGTKVAIEGKLRWSQWNDSDGKSRNRLEVIVDEIEFMTRGNGGGSVASAQPDASAYSAPSTPVIDADASTYDEDVPF